MNRRMITADVTSSGAIPALEAMMRFAGQRQVVLAGNIANISTPDYRQQDLSVAGFRAALADAVEARRSETGGARGELPFAGTREVRMGPDGSLRVTPTLAEGSILFHDRGNRNVERLMQDQVENATMFRVAADLLKSRYDLLRAAIAERV
ncbi:MAG: hypothetical protein JNK35_13155 [Phycisphaerae bacterium]|nr:hypothetical protein [Phycisphaerae bacterium]